MPANMIPALLDQMPTGHGGISRKALQNRKNESQKELLDEIDLAGLEEWNGDEQKKRLESS